MNNDDLTPKERRLAIQEQRDALDADMRRTRDRYVMASLLALAVWCGVVAVLDIWTASNKTLDAFAAAREHDTATSQDSYGATND